MGFRNIKKQFGAAWVGWDVIREKKNTYLDMAIAAAQLRNDDRYNEQNNSHFKNDLAVILFVVQ